MRRIFSMCYEAGLAAVILIPIFLFLNKRYFHHTAKTVWYLLFSVYLCGMFAVVGLPSAYYVRFDPKHNLIPFAYMFSDYENSLLNILLFIPLGFFLPVFWKYFKRFPRTIVFGFCTSMLIEILQIFTFRATDINDLITNTLGTFIGWILGRMMLRLIPSVNPSWKTKEVYLICSLSFLIMFFIQPFLVNIINQFI